MSYQGILRNADGTLVDDGDYKITFDWMACGVSRDHGRATEITVADPNERRSTRLDGERLGELGGEWEDGEELPESTDSRVRT